MHFENPEFDEWSVPMSIGGLSNKGDLKTDMMILALLVKTMDVASSKGDDSYKHLKAELAKLINELKAAMRANLPATANKTDSEKLHMSEEDKKFIVDEMFNIIKGKDGGGLFGFGNMNNFVKDYIMQNFSDDNDDEDND